MVGGSLASSRLRRGDDGVVERPVVAGTAVAMAGAAPSPDLVGPQAPVARSGLDDRLKDLFRQAPGFMVVFRGPEHIVESTNDAYRDLVGARSIIGRPIRDALPELAGQGYFELLDEVFRSGQARKGSHVTFLLQRSPEGPADARVVDFVCEPIRDANGRIFGIFVEGHDVTEAARVDERLREVERLARSTIDALTEHIAVIDADGTIVTVNKAWRDFAVANNPSLPAASEGSNYLAVCDKAASDGDQDAAKVAALVRGVISGKSNQGQWEYENHGAIGPRWLSLKISRFAGDGPVRVVLNDEDITERKSNEWRINYLATHDALTGLPNRNLLEDRTQQLIER